MDMDKINDNVYGAGEGYPSTGAVVGSKVGPAASISRDHGRSGVDRQAPGRVTTTGDGTAGERRRITTGGHPEDDRTETAEEPPRKATRRSLRAANRSEYVFLAPATMDDGTSPVAGGSRGRARSDDEESVASFASRSSLASMASRGKRKRTGATTTPEVSEELEVQMKTSSPAEISAGLTMHVSEIMHVATTSSNLKGTYIRSLKNAASYITAAWNEESARRARPARGAGDDVDARLSMLEGENAALRQELRRLAARVNECPRCADAASEYVRAQWEGGNDRTRLDALERAVRELGPSILRTIEERFGDARWQRTPESRPSGDRPVDPPSAQPTPPRREREDGGWELVETKKKRRRNKKTANGTKAAVAAAAGAEAARKGSTAPPPTRVRRQQQPQPGGTTGAPKANAPAMQRGPPRTPKVVTPPRAPRTSAVTLTLNEGARMSYADVLEAARTRIPLSELGTERLEMKKAMTGAIIIQVPGDKDRGKATLLASRLAETLDPTAVRIATPTRMAELRVTGIDISVKKEELRRALALAAGCGSAEVQVGEIGATRGGLGSAWIKCPAAAARKLAQAEKIALGWSTARIRAVPKRPLQCFRCLELGHVRATCVSGEDRGHLCYRCGGSGHRARGCPASAPKCPLCESLGAPANHRMGGEACNPPKVKRRRPIRQPAAVAAAAVAAAGTPGSAAEPAAAADGREEAMETIRENEVALAAVAEPHRIPDSPNWIGDLDGSAGITWTSASCFLLDRGSGFVAVEWLGAAVVAVYVSPNIDLAAYGDFLDRVGECIGRCLPRQVLVLGDFNAHSTQWGNPRTNSRGRMLTDWAASLGLLLANRGSASTCVAWRGSSVVDITWATPELLRRIRDWRVAEGVETLSDHLYILMEVTLGTEDDAGRRRRGPRENRRHPPPLPRWRLKEMDKEMLRAATTVSAWSWDARRTTERGSIDEEAEELRRYMTAACDASMPRSVPGGGRDQGTYWWTPEIAEMRENCVRARRRFLRARRRRLTRDEEEIARFYEEYREARRTLQREIKTAKSRCWTELIEEVESDPWGRPYKVVTKKLRPSAPPLTSDMDPTLLDNVIGTLFPPEDRDASRPAPSSPSADDDDEEAATTTATGWSEELRVSDEELFEAARRTASRDVAPGPDGIPGRAWAESIVTMAPRLRHLFDRCLEEGAYPRTWRTARLVLLRKEGRPPDSPSAYRPICLLDEVGKMLERIVAARLEAHVTRRTPGWHDSQYGFRRGRSTVDAVKRLRTMAEDKVAREGVAVAVSLDVTNAFNSIPWARIVEALRHFDVPAYLVRIVRAYLSDRYIVYAGRDGEERRRIERGVPQGSVLGPILWITAYDSVLRCPMPPGAGMVCYADDTLVLAGGRWWQDTANRTEDAVACAMSAIRRLGLTVSPAKSEALWFFDQRRRGTPPAGSTVNIGGEEVPVRRQMRYLGLTIDSGWTFEPHFEQLVPKATAAANALCGLLPNIGGAGSRVRRLYEGVVRSRVLYGAPVWARSLATSRRSLTLLRRLQRTTAIRIARGYRTTSYASATVLAASPPFELQALALERVYEHQRRNPTPSTSGQPASNIREEAKKEVWERWRSQLIQEDAVRPHRAVRAVLPNWETWRDRGGAPLTFRMTQLLTGHGVFGEYLLRIRREATSVCHHCEEEEDTAQHTLEFCPAWAEPRRVLRLEIGESLAPEAVVAAMLRGRQEYAAVRTYCEQVMLAKERAERIRERARDPSRTSQRPRNTARHRGATPPPAPPRPP
uniref:uncharacterized protein LOC117156205 n=1 Tax=Bombus vancouverensis nearcticus TaxID=2705178 RepID=UPI0014397965|nr:uncharacterized protein LOC117156205 [Bombus vancouverensis nearcticus]